MWNHPNENKAEVEKKGGRGNVHLKGIVAGAIVVLGAAIAAWWLWPEDVMRKGAASSERGLIREVAPAATNRAVAVKEKEDRNSLEWLKKHDKRYRIPPDAVRAPNGRLYTKGGIRILEDLPKHKIDPTNGRKRVFEHMAEREIARLLVIQPGQIFVGEGHYNNPRFIESFKASLTSPALVSEDDTEEEKALKRQVNEVKADLKARMDAGEDIVEVMKGAEDDLRKLSVYRENLRKEVSAMWLQDDVTPQDCADYVAAANKILEERGLPGLRAPKFTESRLKVMRENHRAREAEKAAKEAEKANLKGNQK